MTKIDIGKHLLEQILIYNTYNFNTIFDKIENTITKPDKIKLITTKVIFGYIFKIYYMESGDSFKILNVSSMIYDSNICNDVLELEEDFFRYNTFPTYRENKNQYNRFNSLMLELLKKYDSSYYDKLILENI